MHSPSCPPTRRVGKTCRPCSLRAATRSAASASATRCDPARPGPRFRSRSAPTGCARRPVAGSRSRTRPAAWWPISTASRSAGARSSHARPIRVCAAMCRVPWDGRSEDKADASVWAVTCFVTRAGFRRRGVSRALARAAVDFARERGARALEGYPMLTEPGKEITWGELHVGSRSIFAAAGLRRGQQAHHPAGRHADRFLSGPVREPAIGSRLRGGS